MKVFLVILLLAVACHAGRYQTSDVNCAAEYMKCMEVETLTQPVTASRRCKDRIRGMDVCAPHAGNPQVGAPPPGMEDCGPTHGGNDC